MRSQLSLVTIVLLLLEACAPTDGNDPVPVDACPRAGTVLADMRDVERDAEGVSYSTFGALPDRSADFTRATGVLSLLKQVWTRSTTACPDFPAVSVAKVDAAIATLAVSVPAGDQQQSAYAANDIHLEMSVLFDFFHPDTPLEVVRMDAVFLRIGLDAWFGDWTAYQSELASLQADFSTLRSTATAKVPSCHRVAGTASVVDDLDQSLANLATAMSTQDVDTAQVESEAGLLEVDILELLFDCPPDGTVPTTGLGSACSADADCGALVCDLDNAGGRCAPPTDATRTGAPCTTTVDCGTYERNACNNEAGDGYPGGYCVLEPCDDVQVCSPGATCVALPFETTACLAGCATDSDCRSDEGYVCQLFPTTPPLGYGPSDHACAFACASDEQCTSPLTCEIASGKCIP